MTLQKTIEDEKKKFADKHFIAVVGNEPNLAADVEKLVDVDDSLDAFALSIIKAVRDEVIKTTIKSRTYNEDFYGVDVECEIAREQLREDINTKFQEIIRSLEE